MTVKRVPKNSEKNMMTHGLLLSKLMRPLQMRHRGEIGSKLVIQMVDFKQLGVLLYQASFQIQLLFSLATAKSELPFWLADIILETFWSVACCWRKPSLCSWCLRPYLWYHASSSCWIVVVQIYSIHWRFSFDQNYKNVWGKILHL